MREQPKSRWRHEEAVTKTNFASRSNGISQRNKRCGVYKERQ